MIIDVHTHVWPDAIAARAITAASAEIKRQGDGRQSSLLDVMEQSGVDRAVCLGIANTPKQLESVNRFAASLDKQHLIGFGSLHADLDVETNLKSLRDNGLKGAKLNPPFQGFSLDDRRLWDILDAMQGEFIVLAHIGAGGCCGTESMCTPHMVHELAARFPRLDLIAAHLGGYHHLEEAESEVVGLPIYIDTSWPPGIGSLDPKRVRSIIERHGTDRVLFGSDWPMGNPANDIEFLESLGLASDDLDAILGGNAQRLLRLQ